MKKIMCSLLCPMLNEYGFCESAMRRAGRVRECPHRKMRERMSPKFTLSKWNTESGRGGGERDV